VTVQTQAIEIRTSPHIKRERSVDAIMANVVYALLPVCGFAMWSFGISAVALLLTTTVSCVLAEHLSCRMAGRESTINDYSATITGLLLGLTLPPGFPLWIAVVGSFISIGLGKAIFGGLGYNPFNPALVGRAFLQASFPVAITTWAPAGAEGRFTSFIPSTLTFPFMTPPYDAVKGWVTEHAVDGFSGATPLSLMKFEGVFTDPIPLFFGMTAGSLGETSAFIILICGAYLVFRRMMDWRIPAAMLLSVFVFSGLFYWSNPEAYPTPLFMLFSGGLMLGAVFMASDMVASPVTPLGVWIYGGLMGFLTVIIRLKGGLPEGVMYAILLGNSVSFIIDGFTQPRVYGTRRKVFTSK
jgi:electron transport complex protein RnfD